MGRRRRKYSRKKLNSRDFYLTYLNNESPLDSWFFEEKCYNVEVDLDLMDKLESYLKHLIGCSYFYEMQGTVLVLKVTKSTLEDGVKSELGVKDKN